ncbi:hypothetical protein GHA01_21720 [Novacetimonas hansenii]|uniref:Uncharacterized protein n=2 Tax=Novacetimonas hansenii TaxID=436 RepID=A0ABQ0SGE0_NOVHA|nr:hypothetical protein GXY_04614 [Novacetimonas hansenii ATCC 23769]GAN85155.1 hypothetical protein Gaha_0325_030 [Novacetimonas hansenii JCM 7643]GEC64323.1 hypothetical protein GHA01_21720 [Novacetimonas hansenii]
MICYLKLYDYIGMDNVMPGITRNLPFPPDGHTTRTANGISIVSRAYEATSFRDTH